jgi:bacillithiol biosynthesis deacetylase BshB2
MTTPERILVVLPHPDDEAFGLSGTLARAVSEGVQVTYACLTLGEMGRNMGIPPFANRVTLPAIRKLELEQSCRAIGIQDLRMGGFHDKTLEFEDKDVLDGYITDLIRELRPSKLYTFYPDHSVHPDHDATGAAVVRSVVRMPAEERPDVLCVAFSKNRDEVLGKPHVTIDVKAFLKQKLASIEAHRSQFQAVELMGSNKLKQREIEDRFGTEVFWRFKFD